MCDPVIYISGGRTKLSTSRILVLVLDSLAPGVCEFINFLRSSVEFDAPAAYPGQYIADIYVTTERSTL